jgi:ribose-phosphate pyrophosphokinase
VVDPSTLVRGPLSEDEVAIFSGLSHHSLATDICAHLSIPLCASSCVRFSNDNLYVRLNSSVRGKDVYIVQTCTEPVQDHLFELFLLLDAARSASAGRITAVIPYYSYARSDKKDEPRISIAARLIADLLQTAGADRVLTMTLHSPQVAGFFRVPTDHLSAQPALAEAIRKLDIPRAVVIAPDIGHAKRAAYLARVLDLPVAAGNKRRIDDRTVVIEGIVGRIDSENAIITDDEIARGTSVVELIAVLRELGIRRVWVTCTHGVFTDGALKRISDVPEVQAIIATDTVPVKPNEHRDKLIVASVAPLFAEAIRRIHCEESVSDLFSRD